MSTTISVCVIGKNEEKNLPAFWQMAGSLADELVYVDTGSTDNSKAISRKAGAKVFDFHWVDDFARARNFSLDQAASDYILILDPDELIAPCDIISLRELTNTNRPTAYQFTTRNYCLRQRQAGFQRNQPDEEYTRGAPGWIPSYKIRLFKRHPQIRFAGVVHEVVDASLAELKYQIRGSSIPIHHYGHLLNDEDLKRKQKFKLDLGCRKAAAAPDDPVAHYELGIALKENGELEQAVISLERASQMAPENAYVFNALGVVYQRLQKQEKARQALMEAVRLKDDYFDAHYNLGILCLNLNDLEGATRAFDRSMALKPDYPPLSYQLGLLSLARGDFGKAAACFDAALKGSYAGWEVYFQQGIALEKGKNFAAAAQAYQTVITMQPENAACRCNLGSLYCKQGDFTRGITEYRLAAQADAKHPTIKLNLTAIANYLLNRLNQTMEQFKAADAKQDAAEATILAIEIENLKNPLTQIRELLKTHYT